MKNIALFLFVMFLAGSANAAKSSAPKFNGDSMLGRASGVVQKQPKYIGPFDRVRIDRANNNAPSYNGEEGRVKNFKKKTRHKKPNSFSENPRKPKSATGNYQE